MPDFLSGSNTQPRTRRVSTPPGTHPHRVQQTRSPIDGSILMIQDPPPPHRSSSKVSAPIRIAAITASRLDLTSSFRRKFVGWFCTVCGLSPISISTCATSQHSARGTQQLYLTRLQRLARPVPFPT